MCNMDISYGNDFDDIDELEAGEDLSEENIFEEMELPDWGQGGEADEGDELTALSFEELEDEIPGENEMQLVREITSNVLDEEIRESWEQDTESILENYRENLREYDVAEDQIEEFVGQEREKLREEFEDSSNVYYQPVDWEAVANALGSQETANEVTEEMNVNYEEIYEDIQREALEQGFEDIQIDADPERLDSSLHNFESKIWETLSLDEQKEAIANLADYAVDTIGFDNPPSIEYYYNDHEGEFGGYDADTNTLHLNEYMLYNSDEAADTVAHELWHAHQHECAENPQSALDYQYQYNFENYISPELGQEAYEEQLVEAEARAFAAQFKDRL